MREGRSVRGNTRRIFLRSMAGALCFPISLRLSGVHAESILPDISKLHSAAKEEGRVTFYCSQPPAMSERLIAVFETTYPGVKIDLLRLSTGPLGKRFETETSSGAYIADVLQLADPLLVEEATAKEWLVKLTDLPAHAVFPVDFKTDTSAMVRIDPHTVTFNDQIVKNANAPAGWVSLTDPRWKGRVLCPDLRISLMLVNWGLLMLETYGPDYLTRLSSQNIRWVPSQIPGSQQLAAGEGSLLFPNQKQVTYSFIQEGAPLVDLVPGPFAGHEGVVVVPSRAPHPHGARLLANFIMSPVGAELLNKDVSYSPIPNIPGSLPMPASYQRARLREAFKRQAEIFELLKLR